MASSQTRVDTTTRKEQWREFCLFGIDPGIKKKGLECVKYTSGLSVFVKNVSFTNMLSPDLESCLLCGYHVKILEIMLYIFFLHFLSLLMCKVQWVTAHLCRSQFGIKILILKLLQLRKEVCLRLFSSHSRPFYQRVKFPSIIPARTLLY